MKKLLIVILMLIQSSCSTSVRITRKYKGIDIKLSHYTEMFISESKGKVKAEDLEKLTMGFMDYPKETSVVGTCWPMGNFTEIDISKYAWERNHSSYYRKELIYHELGHCILGRNHSAITKASGFVASIERFFFKIGLWQPMGYLADGCPASLMHPYMVGDDCFKDHYVYYIEELFANYNPTPVIERFYNFDTDFGYIFDQNRTPQSVENKEECPNAKVVNKTNTWNEGDISTIKRAYKTCEKKYNSCLKIFTKTSESSYQAICGE